jgi:hypothetical protein
MVVGVSKIEHAQETFRYLRNRFSDKSHL